jgi:hypothetical protein
MSLSRQDNKDTKGRLNGGRRIHVSEACLKKVQGKLEVRRIPSGKGDTVAKILSSRRRRDKLIEMSAIDNVGIKIIFVQVEINAF